ncbi:hypothetical protein WL26_24090 [Burkholderia cepacia]|nr:hypothetical protein WL26_24090 [Burkholderia cepacia]
MQIAQFLPEKLAYEIDVSLDLSRFLYWESTFQVHCKQVIRRAEEIVGCYVYMNRVFPEFELSKLRSSGNCSWE